MKSTDSHTSKGLESLARIGYAAKGVVYAMIGLLAAMAAFGLGGETTGTKGAINELSGQPFGQIMLVSMTVGLAGYVVWRFTQSFADPDGKGAGLRGIAARSGLLVSGLVYGGLAAYTVELLLSAGAGDGGSAQDHTAWLMSYTGGILLVAAIGLGFIGVGLYQAWRAYARKFREDWNTAEMGPDREHWATRVARIGLCARALVFMTIGVFLIIAARQADPSEARGLGGALSALAAQPYGPWLMGFVALGLVCYGFYCFVNARFRHINP